MLLHASPISDLIADTPLPEDFVTGSEGPLAGVLSRVFYTDYVTSLSPDGFALSIDLVLAGEAAISLPGLDSLAIVLGAGNDGVTTFAAGFSVGSKGFAVRLEEITLALRFPPSVLRPAPDENGQITSQYAQIETTASLSLDEEFNFDVEALESFTLRPAMIGDSGIIISAENVKLSSRLGTSDATG